MDVMGMVALFSNTLDRGRRLSLGMDALFSHALDHGRH